MSNKVNAFGGTILSLTTLVVTVSLILDVTFVYTGTSLGFHTGIFAPYMIEQVAGLFAFALVYFLGCLTLKIYHKEPLKLWLLQSIAWLPVIALCAVLAEIIFYDSSFPVGGALARYAAEWFSTRLSRMVSIVAVFVSATLYAWLMVNMYGKDHNFSTRFENRI